MKSFALGGPPPRAPWVLAVTLSLVLAASGSQVLGNPFDVKVRALAEGDRPPATALVDQRGATVRLSDFVGSTVVVGFIYTHCTDECPLISQKFAKLTALLPPDRYHLVEVSVDPSRDTLPAMEAYAAKYGARPARWSMLTGPPSAVDWFLRSMGVSTLDAGQGKVIHNDRLVIIGRDGRIATFIDDARWVPADVAAELRFLGGERSSLLGRLNLALESAGAACGSFISTHSGLSDALGTVAIFALFGYAFYWVRRRFFAEQVH